MVVFPECLCESPVTIGKEPFEKKWSPHCFSLSPSRARDEVDRSPRRGRQGQVRNGPAAMTGP